MTSLREADVLDCLRSLMPHRAISWLEARSIAERQATKLLQLSGITEPYVPLFVITSLPGVVVEFLPNWPTSGMATPSSHGFRIVINADEPLVRRRFSAAHELKHCLDDVVVDCTSRHLSKADAHRRAEAICNYFAACLLMPRRWIVRDWAAGIQSLELLRQRYAVSSDAMAIRLTTLRLFEPIPRKVPR